MTVLWFVLSYMGVVVLIWLLPRRLFPGAEPDTTPECEARAEDAARTRFNVFRVVAVLMGITFIVIRWFTSFAHVLQIYWITLVFGLMVLIEMLARLKETEWRSMYAWIRFGLAIPLVAASLVMLIV